MGDAQMSSGSEFQTVCASKAKLLSGLVNCGFKFWYIEEIGNTQTASSIVSSDHTSVFFINHSQISIFGNLP